MFPISLGVCPLQELEIDVRVEEEPHDVGLEVIEQDIVDSSIGSWRRRNFSCMTTPILWGFCCLSKLHISGFPMN